MKEEEVVTLFVDELPWEMSRDWLRNIFRGEGEAIDIYLTDKRQFNDSRFDFVHFKKLEEAMNAVRNLD